MCVCARTHARTPVLGGWEGASLFARGSTCWLRLKQFMPLVNPHNLGFRGCQNPHSILPSSRTPIETQPPGDALFQTHNDLEHLAMMEAVLGRLPEAMALRANKSQRLFSGSRCVCVCVREREREREREIQ